MSKRSRRAFNLIYQMDKMMSHNCDSIEMSDESDNEGFVRDSKEPIFLRRRTYDMKTLAKLRLVFQAKIHSSLAPSSVHSALENLFLVAHNIHYQHRCRKEGQPLSGKKKGLGSKINIYVMVSSIFKFH